MNNEIVDKLSTSSIHQQAHHYLVKPTIAKGAFAATGLVPMDPDQVLASLLGVHCLEMEWTVFKPAQTDHLIQPMSCTLEAVCLAYGWHTKD